MSDESSAATLRKVREWFNRPYWKYRRASVGPQFTNGAMLLLALALVGMGAGAIWMLLGVIP